MPRAFKLQSCSVSLQWFSHCYGRASSPWPGTQNFRSHPRFGFPNLGRRAPAGLSHGALQVTGRTVQVGEHCELWVRIQHTEKAGQATLEDEEA